MRSDPSRAMRLGLAGMLLVLVAASPAAADRQHTVRSGQTLSHIAHRYGIEVATLAAANRMRRNGVLREGQVIRVPDRGVIYVGRGDTLASIARSHGVEVEQLARKNRIRSVDRLRAGQRLVLPGYSGDKNRDDRWGRPKRPGVATFVSKGRRTRVRLVNRRGRARGAARTQLARIMDERGVRGRRRPPRRLVELLARVSDHFGGRPIYVASGYRKAGGFTKESSRHTSGRALDFRVRGVPNEVVRDYCRTLGDVGVGYYPNSTFVHLDVRDRAAYWVDHSGPGEPPKYPRKPIEVTADELEGGPIDPNALPKSVSASTPRRDES